MSEQAAFDRHDNVEQLRQLETWVREDELLMKLLQTVKQAAPKDSFIAAGAVRNLVWDRLHEYKSRTPLHDVDVVYYDAEMISHQVELQTELRLQHKLPEVEWQVRNQARMHVRNGDAPYLTVSRAMQGWPETATAVGVRISDAGSFDWIHPWGLGDLFELKLRRSPLSRDGATYTQRIKGKNWLHRWPLLTVVT